MIKLPGKGVQIEKERLTIPQSVQQAIPIKRIYKDGIWQVGGRYSRTWRFYDINYSVASHEDQAELFMLYCALLNALPTEAETKITVNNRRLNLQEFAQSILLQMEKNNLDLYRRELNEMLTEKAKDSNNLVQEKYITVSVQKKSVEEARSFFVRVGNDLTASLSKLSSRAVELTNNDRLRIFHDFYRSGQEQYFRFDLSEAMRKGHDYKDTICPEDLQFKADHIKMGGKYGRVLFLREYPT